MIIGERIRLRAIKTEDLPNFATWLNDPEVHRNLRIYCPLSMKEEEKWFDEILTHPAEEQPLAIEVKNEKKWKLVGNTSFINVNLHVRSAELGILIGDKQYWGKGLGTETMRLMVEYGFMNLNLNRIYLHVNEINLRGIHCYEKVGFKLEGRLREAHFLEGRYIDMLIMSILKNEWMKENMKEGRA